MKKMKFLLYVFFLCAPLTVAAQDIEVNAKNFPDDFFRSYLLNQDYGKDGIITAAEIQQITLVDVNYGQISSLKGIEHFTALENLTCYANDQLVFLDVSHNIAMTILDCGGCPLTKLDVSHNTALTMLTCYNNLLTDLDISHNTALNFLDCTYNMLTELDVSHNTALSRFGCNNNQLKELDVASNAALMEFHCERNLLTKLNLPHNDVLRWVFCNDNNLTSLDASHNTSLENLDCSRNQLTDLDVSGCTALAFFDCSTNQIKGASMDAFINSLPQVNKKELRIYNDMYGNEGNVITKSQVAAAKAKGWIPCYYDYDLSAWKEYEGSNDDPASIAMPEIENGNASVYNLSGQKEASPVKGGIYVVGGKKVVVK